MSDQESQHDHDGEQPPMAGNSQPASLPPVVPPVDAHVAGSPQPDASARQSDTAKTAVSFEEPDIVTGVTILDKPLAAAELAVERLKIDEATRLIYESEIRRRRKQFRTSVILFVLTFLSTTLVGAEYWPIDILSGFFDDKTRRRIMWELMFVWPPEPGVIPTLADRFWQSIQVGCTYSCPLMLILFCHEMGHYVQAVRNRVPASFPYFIPLPLRPLGTMGAVILQGRGAADRCKMFDIAVSGPIAGLIVTMPILVYGIWTSEYTFPLFGADFEFGQPILVSWIIDAIHGEALPGMMFHWNGWATAGWVGVFITAMNLLPVGQLDGGHIMYTLVGRPAHYIAWALIIVAVAAMIGFEMYSYILLLILLTLTGPRHPPTSNDAMPLGWKRQVVGWLTLAFLVIGFTPQPIMIPERRPRIDILEPLEILSDRISELSNE